MNGATNRRFFNSLLLLAMVLACGEAGAEDQVRSSEPRVESWPSYWQRGRSRHFLSAQIDVGLLFFRPRLSAGYGRPYYSWLGLEANPIVSGEGVGAWFGLRAASPVGDLRIGGRYRYTFRRSFLPPRESYDREEIERRNGPHSSYVSLEAELTGYLPLGPGLVISELAGTAVQGVDDGYYLYEETIRVVLKPPFVWRARLGYALGFGERKKLRVGGVLEVVGIPGRETAILRGGLVVRLRLYNHLEARGTFIPVLVSKDSLGLAGADAYMIGVRYRWATGVRSFL